jgi:hypothetical protein
MRVRDSSWMSLLAVVGIKSRASSGSEVVLVPLSFEKDLKSTSGCPISRRRAGDSDTKQKMITVATIDEATEVIIVSRISVERWFCTTAKPASTTFIFFSIRRMAAEASLNCFKLFKTRTMRLLGIRGCVVTYRFLRFGGVLQNLKE